MPLEARPLQRKVQLSPGGRRLARQRVERPDRRVDAERLQDPEHFRADGLIGAQAAKRDAARWAPWFTSAPSQ